MHAIHKPVKPECGKVDDIDTLMQNEEMQNQVECKQALEQNSVKSCNAMWGQSTPMIHQEVEASTGCEALHDTHDPLTPLVSIEGVNFNFNDQKCMAHDQMRKRV